MLLRAYVVFDSKALIYNRPFFEVSDAVAIRMFSDLVNDAQSTVARHPADYSLWCVGAFDDQNGHLADIKPLQHVADAITLVKQQADMFKMPPDMKWQDFAAWFEKTRANGEVK